jgi:hypothetical protein
MADVVELIVKVGEDDRPRVFIGRFAWCLFELVEAGERGVTSLERPAPRWSHYVHRLRRDGMAIETVEENHDGAYAGRHGRYRLSVPVVVLGEKRA